MLGGSRLLTALFVVLLCMAAMVFAEDSKSSDSVPSSGQAGPPKVKVIPVEETVQGHKIVDRYRYLENANDPETKLYVEQELIYTRSILDPLPGRDRINARLSELLEIGTVGVPQFGGNYYFHTRREGNQNQPLLYIREALNGEDRVLVDVNKMSSDGTVALDWWFASEDGKYVAYGTSPSGSEESTLHIVESATGKLLPDTIDRTRFASIAWMKDSSAFYYTRHPKKGEVPDGEEVYHVKVFYHQLGTDPAKDPLIFGEGRKPQDIPQVTLSEDDRWLLIDVGEGWTKTEMYLKDLRSNDAPLEITTGKDFLYGGDFFEGKLYITTNEDAPHYRVFVTDAAKAKRENWKEIIPQTDGVLQNASVTGGKLLVQYEHNATSELKIFSLEGKKLSDISLPAIGTVFGTSGRYDRDEIFFGFQSFTVPPSIYRVPLDDVTSGLWAKVDAPSIDPSAYDVQQVWYSSKDGTKVPMFVVSKKGTVKNGKNPTLLTGYGGFNISLTPGFSGWNTAASTPSPICAGALNLERTGIAPACSTKSRTFLTISLPRANT
ncbi:MAG: hypothetical protein ABSD53_21780 [Terriglobales bacterium]